MHQALLNWSARTRRDLPWRHTRDPWAVLVSEVMLQQTQVPRVVPKYRAFLERFPSAAACAASPVADVVRQWAGLGYNRRAVNLHGAAVAVVERHGGAFPDDLDALIALPGVGPYTARAVLTFAFGRDVGIVESNTGRVLARVAGRPLSQREAQQYADDLVPEGDGWAWNQAMIDLGATVCLRRTPKCRECPVTAHCRWHGGADPAAPATKQSTFAGSDRQGRGRLVDAMRLAPVPVDSLPAAAGWPDDPARAHRVAPPSSPTASPSSSTAPSACRNRSKDFVDRAVREGGHLFVGAVLDGMGDEDAGRVEAECFRLGLSGVDELCRRDEDAGQSATFEIGDVVHTARRATASVG